MTNSLLVLGSGGHGRSVADAAASSGYAKIAFLDDHPGQSSGEWPVLGPVSLLEQIASEWPAAISAVGDASTRLRFFNRLLEHGFETPNIVHPSSVISDRAQLGRGVFVAAGAIINIGSTIGDAVIINTGARVDHDCTVEQGAHIAPGVTLSGSVHIGHRAWLGTGCVVRQGIVIGEDTMIGVGAAVVSDVPAGETYVGVPAKPLATN